ncbi:sacsin N-terminal ATP-binding-like domain-containing protein [Antribacter gilvus]|uniref:sacsin N-terminal ATP-binding-like domain-containing protein n=1 Tax=Antribacter gilvus TaxID=2304675 RepID=UPI000F78EC67|nr:ATP-binding protein [Antribacter gilvus]
MTHDAFGTAALRRAVTEAWLASPTRLREDANSEEDHARGYYRDRVVVELAQNAADAAARAGAPGRLSLRLEPADDGSWRLVASNSGAPLDAGGVASLASLRASSKAGAAAVPVPDHDVVGRFGVGFAAVRSVSDEVVVRSRSGGVRFSLSETQQLLREVPDAPAWVQDLVRSRPAALPVLRLPFPAPATRDDEPDTVVELSLRDDDAVAAVRRQLEAVDDALLLALPALDEIVVEEAPAAGVRFENAIRPAPDPNGGPDGVLEADTRRRTLRDVGSRWLAYRAAGPLDPDPALPVEAQRTGWTVLWAVPRAAGRGAAAGVRTAAAGPRLLHAPTPTDVPLSFPALLIASFPVDPGRRGVLPGAATDRIATEAGRAYAAFVGELAAGPPADAGRADAGRAGPAGRADAGPVDALDLVPTGLPAGELDSAIRDAASQALRGTPLLRTPAPAPEAQEGLVAPQGAVLLGGDVAEDPAVARALAPAVTGYFSDAGGPDPVLVALPRRHHALARRLGARAVDLADLLAELPVDPATVRAALDALAPHVGDPAVLEALAGAPVPLADGRTARGARGTVVLPTDELLRRSTAVLGVRAVHPDAAHPVLSRAGAVPTTPRALLDDASVRASSLAAADEILEGDLEWPGTLETTGPWAVVGATLGLARLAIEEDADAALPFWLGELPVETADGLVPLRESVLPGTPAERLLPELAPVSDDVVRTWGADVLAAAGARADLAVYRVRDVVVPEPGDEPETGPDDPAGWLPAWDEYLEHLGDLLGPGSWLGDLEAVADLDATGDDDPDAGLAALLARIAADPAARQALLTPVRSPDSGGSAPSYTAWWLRRELGAPFALRADVPLLPPVPAPARGLDEPVLRAVGGVDDLEVLGPEDWPVLLTALPDAGARLPAHVALALWRGLAALAADERAELDPLPDRLPALGPDGTAVVERADDLVVAASARWAQLEWADGNAVVPAPARAARALADLLDLPLVGDQGDVVPPDSPGARTPLHPHVRALSPALPEVWFAHERLTVEGREVAWWLTADGAAHATGVTGLARALAEVSGLDRLLLEAALRQPERADALTAESAWEPA